MLFMPVLETGRLSIRPFTMDDLDVIHRILDVELEFSSGPPTRHELHELYNARREWLQWTVLNYVALARLYQPPYGDRAITLRGSGELIGSVGYVPSFGPFGQLPGFASAGEPARLFVPELGLFYAVSPPHQGRGYAGEAAKALVDYAFGELHAQRVVATTEYDNAGSIGVMRRLGMRIERNPLREPGWFQVVGLLENRQLSGRNHSE